MKRKPYVLEERRLQILCSKLEENVLACLSLTADGVSPGLQADQVALDAALARFDI